MSVASAWRRHDWLIPAGLILLSLVPAMAGIARVAGLAAGGPVTSANARFVAMPLPILLHVLSVIPYTLLGALQFAPGYRHRHRRWHRAAGRVLVVCGLVAATTGLWMTLRYPWPAGDGIALYCERLVFGTAMLLSLGLAVDAIRRRNFAEHGAWMIRAYAIGMGAGTQVLTHLPYFLLVGKPTVIARAMMMGAGWVISVGVAEWIIRRGRAPRSVAGGGDVRVTRRMTRSAVPWADSESAPGA